MATRRASAAGSSSAERMPSTVSSASGLTFMTTSPVVATASAGAEDSSGAHGLVGGVSTLMIYNMVIGETPDGSARVAHDTAATGPPTTGPPPVSRSLRHQRDGGWTGGGTGVGQGRDGGRDRGVAPRVGIL